MWEILTVIIAIAGFVFSIINYMLIKNVDRRNVYLELERTSDILFTLPIEKDFLNKLYFEKLTDELPDSGTKLGDLTEEQRAILNFASIHLDYFEQVILLHERNMLPDKIMNTWDPWLVECAKAPYFIWAWKRLKKHYHPDLIKSIEKKLRES